MENQNITHTGVVSKYIANGKIDLAISTFLNQDGISNSTRETLIQYSFRHNRNEEAWNKALISYEKYNQEQAKLVKALLDQIASLKDKVTSLEANLNQLTVLVAGTAYNLLEEQIWICEELGKMLGQSKYFLVTGGWRGVDKFVAEKYSEQIIDTHNESLSKYLTQIVIKGNTPGFIGGNVFQIEPGIMEWIKCLNLVDLVILIGGMNRSDNSRGGTYQTYKFALQERVPVLPIRGSKQDCEEIFEELIKSWDPKLYSHFDRREFIKELGHPIENRTDAIIVVEGLKHIMNNYVIKRRS